NWLPYTYKFKGGAAMRSRWAMRYGQAYHVFPWASPWGASLQRDLPLLADDLDLYAVDFDMFGDYSLYRGKLLQHLSGWAWDEKGPFIATALGQKHAAEYVKSVSKGPFRLAVMAGMGSTFPSSFTPDGYITEAGSRNTFPVPYNYYKPYPRGVHGRWHLGHKPLFTFNGGIHNAIGNVVPWRDLTPEQLRLIYQLHLEDWIQASLQAGFIPGGRMVRGNEVIARAMPMLLDVQSRGWEPVPAATGQSALRRQRYGAGLNAALVVSNPTRRESLFTGREKVHTRETFDSRYLGDFDVLPVDYEGRSLDFTVSGRRTTFELDVCTRENRIIVFPVGIRTAKRNAFSGNVSSDVSIEHIRHRFILNAPKATPVQVLVKSPRDYQLEEIVWNGQKTAPEGKVQLRKGKNTLEVSFASTIFRVSEEKLLHFPYAKCALAVTLKPGKRENGTAQMIQDYLKIHEPAPSQVGRYWKKPLHLKQLSQNNKNLIWLRSGVDARERGIVLDEESNILTIAGTDAFDTQQLAWRLLRFLDRKYSPYIGILHFSGSTGLESKKMMSKAKLHGQTIMTWDFNGRPLSTGMFRYGTALKIENPEKISLPADLDSRLNLKGVFGSAVTMAHIWDPEDVLDQKLPEATAPLLDVIPVMDGRLDEAIWKTASKINAFSLLGKTAKPTQATTVRVFHNGKALFLGIVCEKEQMQQLGANIVERDGPLWGNDSVELFLAPGVKREAIRYPYYQFIFNAAGTQYDSYAGDKSWNGKWEVATHRGKRFWSVEVRIPFDVMKKCRSKTWRFNVGRTDIAGGEISTWSPLLRGFQEPYRFGVLRFGGQ
ncbi:MAG: carbohydrate binding family 9 domain-containing protein, partial [Victivallaceae bacterium]|nr:carbohydrate binding family 9 domain-containing protein [Victivallaceae bacterium]